MAQDSRRQAGRNPFRNPRIVGAGIALGLAAFVAIGLVIMVGAGPQSPQAPVETGTGSASDPAAPAEQLSEAFARVAERVRPAVVGVYAERKIKFGRPEAPFPFDDEFFRRFFGEGVPQMPAPRQRGMGSGMIIDEKGHILTNYHVVGDMDEIQVRLADRRAFKAEVIGSDPPSDVAVIRIKGEVPDGLPTVQFGDSDSLKVGHLVMAVGAPFGFTQTVTTGVLSAKDRSGIGINDYEDFLQTDAAINPGNSGGPLVNMRGEVIGINSAIATQIGQFAGVGFAIPINMVKSMLPTLLEGGHVTRGLLGVVIQDVTPELAEQFGVEDARGALVAQVNDDSPAKDAGIEPGDVIVRYEGKAVTSVAQLRNLVAGTQPGTQADVVVIRGGKEKSLSVTVGTLPAEDAVARGPSAGKKSEVDDLGFAIRTLTPDVARQYGYEGQEGVIVTGVQGGSPAARAGVRRGDLVIEANRRPVTNVEELRRAIGSAGDSVLLRLRRQQASLFVVLPLK